MRNILFSLALFTILAIVLSTLTGCSGSAGGQNVANNTNAAANVNAQTTSQNGGDADKTSQYPPGPAAVMQADIKALDGTTFKVDNRKGEILLLNLWATWCGPCRGEMPELVEMQNKYSDKKFKVIGLNTDDESADDIKDFVAQMKLNYEIAWADRPVITELFRITRFQGIPQSFLIDREGRLRGVFTGGGPKVIAQMKETVAKVVNE